MRSRWCIWLVNHTRKRQWLGVGERGIATPKRNRHQKMVILSVWWGVKGVIHSELLPTGSTITADVYCEQLDRVAEKLQGKQDKVYFLHDDNARPHIAKKSTHQKLLELGWSILPHPSYSPDLAPIHYHLFRSFTNLTWVRKNSTMKMTLKWDLKNFFDQKPNQFYQHQILSLPKNVGDKSKIIIDAYTPFKFNSVIALKK
jgi:histone-lysine N-methyltransferase SETMAR